MAWSKNCRISERCYKKINRQDAKSPRKEITLFFLATLRLGGSNDFSGVLP
jgi:hypothetical protein